MPVSHIQQLPGWARELTETAPLGHLGFLDDRRLPRVLPVTFAAAGEAFWTAVIELEPVQPRRPPVTATAAVGAKQVAAVMGVLLAAVLAGGTLSGHQSDRPHHRVTFDEPAPAALEALTAKYAPYREREPAGPFLRLVPERILCWSAT